MVNLNNKIVLVTGASRGQGEGIAHTLQQGGATVVGTRRRLAAARDIAARLGLMPLVLDVTDIASIRPVVEAVAAHYGRLDILVNNAGVNIPQGMFEVDEASWDTVLDTNLKSLFFTS